MKKIDFRLTPTERKDWIKITTETNNLINEVKKEISTLLKIEPRDIYLTNNIKPWYFLPHLLVEGIDRSINIVLDDENKILIETSKLIRKAGMTLEYIPPPKRLDEKIFEHYNPRHIFSLITSLVKPVTGRRIRIQDIAKYLYSNNIKLILDISYALGTININSKKINPDILISNPYFVSGSNQIGIIYINQDTIEIQELKRPYNLIEKLSNVIQKSTLKTLLNNLKEINETGIKEIENKILSLGGWMIDELRKKGYKILTPIQRDERAGIISIQTDEKTNVLYRELEKENIYVDNLGGIIRICLTHRHNDEDIKQLLKIFSRVS